jgi:FlaA1/EpsC-like NDP-sugar epimerase
MSFWLACEATQKVIFLLAIYTSAVDYRNNTELVEIHSAMKTILIEALLVVASVLFWLIVLPLAALLSPVLVPLLALEAQRSPILPPARNRPSRARVSPPVRLMPGWRMAQNKGF